MSNAYDMIDRFLRNNLNSDEDYAEYSAALESLIQPQARDPLTNEFCIVEMHDMGQRSLQLMFKSREHADKFKAAHGIKVET